MRGKKVALTNIWETVKETGRKYIITKGSWGDPVKNKLCQKK